MHVASSERTIERNKKGGEKERFTSAISFGIAKEGRRRDRDRMEGLGGVAKGGAARLRGSP